MSERTVAGGRWRPGRPQPRPRVVLISGGSRGIGAALARAHRSRGDTVIVADLAPRTAGELRLDVRDADA